MEQEVPVETVTDIEAAERQLCVAIQLFFERRDLIAVHTLATAAQDVLRRLAKKQGIKGMYEHADDRFRPEMNAEGQVLFLYIRNRKTTTGSVLEN